MVVGNAATMSTPPCRFDDSKTRFLDKIDKAHPVVTKNFKCKQ